MRDPGGFTVAATAGAADAFGMLSWSVPLSAEPVLGQWKVVASSTGAAGAAAAEREFDVAKYVLPTFSVGVLPARTFLLQGARSVDGTLSVTHTNGAPVAGSVLLSIYQPSYSYNYYGGGGIMGRPAMMADSMPSMPSSEDSVVIDGASATLLATLALYTAADGTAAFSVMLPTGMMGSSARAVSWSGAPLVLLATVTETATGETLNGAWGGRMLAGAPSCR